MRDKIAGDFYINMMNFALRTRTYVSKTRNFVLKMMNFAGELKQKDLDEVRFQ